MNPDCTCAREAGSSGMFASLLPVSTGSRPSRCRSWRPGAVSVFGWWNLDANLSPAHAATKAAR
jgi:hypothetical protein